MSGHLAGITVDAVREQLAALGQDDVSDDVIASFLTSLDHQVGIGHNLTSTSSSSGDGLTKPDGGAVGGADTAVHDTAVHARGHGDAPSSPSHKRNNASLRRYSSKALAARTPGGSEIISSAETRVSADDEAGAMTPSPSSAASKRAARATPNGTRVRPASSGHRTAVLAIPTKCSPTTEPKASKTHPKTHTPSSATTRHRRAHAPNADTHEDIIGWCAKRSVQPVTPHTTRTSSSSSSAATPGSSDKTKNKNKTSVIKSSMPVRPGTFTPGQRVRIDRVARAAQYNAVWSGDAYLERRGGDGTNSNKFPVFAGGKVNSTSSRLRFDDMENADEATVFGTKPRVEDINVCGVNSAVYDVNGPRGGSWGRAQRKLTDGVNENRLEKGKTSSGFWDQKRVTAVQHKGTDGGFKTPGENRRDALRWEVRARMAAPPTF